MVKFYQVNPADPGVFNKISEKNSEKNSSPVKDKSSNDDNYRLTFSLQNLNPKKNNQSKLKAPSKLSSANIGKKPVAVSGKNSALQ